MLSLRLSEPRPAIGPLRSLLARRFVLGFLVPLAGLIVLGGAYFWSDEAEPANPRDSQSASPPVAASLAALVGPAKVGDSPREQALRLLGEARQAYQSVQDYRCTLAMREQVGGQLQPEQIMAMEFRGEPFSVHFRWQQPTSKIGQEVFYVIGKNRGKMRVRPAGGLGSLVRFLSVSPNSASVRENSRHTITEAGLGNMLEQFCRAWEQKAAEEVEVLLDDASVDGKPCRRLEVRLVVPEESADWRRSVLFIEQEARLPLRVEYYDPQGELLEESTYLNLKINMGLADESFTP